ncbi:MAG: pyridoxal-phosphate dependent enzyme [Hyphomicrobiales bacterium]|nr:pyridoxal-phosphate dependent enzyme [Hyphomicrobiales bacterium]
MATVTGLQCLRCGAPYPADAFADDCARCRPEAPSGLVVCYDRAVRSRRDKPAAGGRNSLWRFGDILPVAESRAVSLGEGGSPLHTLHALGGVLGLAALLAKDETRNPTWSFKDRMACLAVSTAKQLGARVVVSSSTGNAGASVAAYAAKAGLPCVVFTTRGAVGPLVTQMRVYGACVVAVENKADRWTLMQHAVRRLGWFPTSPFFGPVVGSNPYGIEGYKTLAYEVVEQMGWRVPACCVLPVCYGDALLGMWRGFEDMRAFGWIDRSPRMIAAEIYGSLTEGLRSGGDALPDMPMTHDTVAKSTSATRSTYQALHVIRQSGGSATVVDNASIMTWQQRLAETEGLYVEPASAGAIAAVAQLCRAGGIAPGDTVVALLTASGLKDPGASAAAQAELVSVPSDVDAAFAKLRDLKLIPS